MISLRDPECARCALSKGCRTICIEGDGPLTAPILALGEAPGEYEDRTGQVFIGRSGQFYRACLEALGLVGEVRTENAVRCRPENNRTPTAEERDACSVYLERTVRAMPNLRIIVAMGKTACSAVGWKGQLMKQAGTPFSTVLYDRPVTVVPIVHPAYIVRNLPYASVWEEHWRGVKGLLTPPETAEMDTICGRVEGPEEWWAKEPVLALDLETTHLEARHASILTYAVSSGGRTQAFPVRDANDLRRLRDLTQGPRTLVVHNAGFEGLILERLVGVRPGHVVDTMLLQARVNPWSARSLAALTAHHLPEIAGFKSETDILSAQGIPYWEFPKEALLRRNSLDAWATARLYQKLSAALDVEALKYAEEDAQLLMFVARMEERGLWMDEERMEQLGKQAELDKEQAVDSIRQLTGKTVNPGSNPQVGDLLESLGVRLERSPAGNPIADEAALKGVRIPDPKTGEVITSILRYRGAVKLAGTYLKGYAIRRHGDGYLRSHFHFPGTVSWRPSSSGPNLLNVPRGDFRKVFRAPPGMKVIEGDMGQFQFRAVAVLCQDPAMLAAIREGDPHGRLAERYFGLGYSKDQRHHAKTCNFLMIFEGGPGVLQEEFLKQGSPIDWATAKRYHAGFHDLYARLKPYWDRLYGEARSGLPVRCPTGGYSWRLEDAVQAMNGKVDDALGTLGNAQVQAVESRLTLRAGLRLEAEGILPVLDTYDGIVAYADEKNALDAARRVRYTLEAVAQEEPWMQGNPFPADAKCGDSWGELEGVE